MKKEIIVRQINPDDSIPEITELLHSSYRQLAEMGFRYFATHQDSSETKKRLDKGISYLAVSEDKILSTISLYYKKYSDVIEESKADWYNNDGVAHFGQFAVLPEFQKMGIGNFLMDIVEAKAKQLGAREIALDTAEGAAHLIEYYEKRGYRFIEYVNWDVTNYRSVIMSKVL